MTDDKVTIVKPLPKPKTQRKIINHPLRRNSIRPWKPSSTPPTAARQQSLTQMIPGLTQPKQIVDDSEEDDDNIIGEPAPKRRRMLTPATSEHSADGSAAKPSTISKQRRKIRAQLESQADYEPPGSKVKKPRTNQKKRKKAGSTTRKPKNTLTQAYDFVRSGTTLYYSDEDVQPPCAQRPHTTRILDDSITMVQVENAGEEQPAMPEIPNSSSQARDGHDPYHPYGDAVAHSQHQDLNLATPQKKGKYADVEELPNSQPTPSLTPVNQARRPLLPMSGNVRFASPLTSKSQKAEDLLGEGENTPRPWVKSLSTARHSPTPRPIKSLSQLPPVIDGSTEDEDEGLVDEILQPSKSLLSNEKDDAEDSALQPDDQSMRLNETNVYEDLSKSQWEVAAKITGASATVEPQKKFETPLTLEEELQRAKQCKSQGDQYLHIQHLERMLEKRRTRDREPTGPAEVQLIEDSEPDELASDLEEVYESAVEGNHDMDTDADDGAYQHDDDDYDMEPKTFNPVEDALDRDASRFFMTQGETQAANQRSGATADAADAAATYLLANADEGRGRSQNTKQIVDETQIKEETVDRILSTPPKECSKRILDVPPRVNEHPAEAEEDAIMFSTALEAGRVVIPSSQEDERATSSHEEVLLGGYEKHIGAVRRQATDTHGDDLELIHSTPPASSWLRPSQISTVLPTQASQARMAAGLTEDEEGEEEVAVVHPATSQHSSSPEVMARLHQSSPHVPHQESAPTSPPSHVRGSQIDLLKDLDWYKMPPPRLDNELNDPAELPGVTQKTPSSQRQNSMSTIASSPLVGPPGYTQTDWTRKSNWSQTQMTNGIDYSLPAPPPLSSARDLGDSQ